MTYAEAISQITDELCLAVDDNFDLHIDLDSDDIDLQRLAVLINFLLEKVRRNIAGHKALEQTLEQTIAERTERLDLVVAGSNDGVWVWEICSDRVEYSSRWLAIAGLTPSDLGDTLSAWLDRVHPQDIGGLRTAIRRHLEGLSSNVEASYRLRHGSGVYRWMWCRGLCLRDNAGRPRLMAGTQSDITHMRSIDPQTGLPNERYLEEHLEALLNAQRALTLLLIEVSTRDTLHGYSGPETGRLLRTAAAERITALMPFGATLCRLYGDFFALISPAEQVSEGQARNLCQGLCDAFTTPLLVGDRRVGTSALIGAAEYRSDHGTGVVEVMRDVWNSLTCARQSGKGFNILSDAQRLANERREWLAGELGDALRKGYLVPYLQPIVHLTNARLYGFEMLTRLHHPDKGLIMPGEFIAVAEDLGLMRVLGDFLLQRALELLTSWRANPDLPDDLVISINISAPELAMPDFAERIITAVRAANCAEKQLKLEITEGSLIDNLGMARQHLESLRDRGFGIALDDFGTGFSSLRYLQELPITTLKIDRSFVDGIECDGDKRAVAKTIHGLAGLMGADVIAEGIESPNQVAELKSMDVPLGQGFLFAKPLPPEAVESFIKEAHQAV